MRNHPLRLSILALSVMLLLLSAGCTSPVHTVPQEDQAELFIPATRVVSPAPTMTITPALPRATPTVTCEDNLKFLSDITIPDGMEVSPGATIDKRWEVENTGTCHWNERYALVNIEGSELGTEEKQTLFPALSGARATLQVKFSAPTEPGTYRSIWQAAGPDGELFGDRFYVEFIVTAP
jgi:hypothetical protein